MSNYLPATASAARNCIIAWNWAVMSLTTTVSDGVAGICQRKLSQVKISGWPWNAYQFYAVSLSCACKFWYDLSLHSRQHLNFSVTVKSLPLDGAVMKIPW